MMGESSKLGGNINKHEIQRVKRMYLLNDLQNSENEPCEICDCIINISFVFYYLFFAP